MKLRHVLAGLAGVSFSLSSPAQGIDPIGRVHPAAQPLAAIARLPVPAIDLATIALEDEQRRSNGQPARFAIPFPVSADPTTHGTWEQLDATWSLWRLRIDAPNASHVNLGFGDFHLPAGARFMVYASDYSDIVRPFDAEDHTPTGALWTPVVRTAGIVAELYVPTLLRPQARLTLVQVGSGYRFFGAGAVAGGVDGSGTCQVDVVCPQGAPWLEEIGSVAAISSGGSIFCSGFMVNNTSLDRKNYFMTAHHCGVTAGVAPSLVVYWNYQEATCGGTGAPLFQFNTGSTLRASWANSDFTLLELTSAPNPAFGVTYAGWNRNTANATSAVGIHHPSGDSKKISFEYNPTITTSYGSGNQPGDSTHVCVIDWDLGTTEPGSSGSPLFDSNHRVIGQLHGGGSACGNNFADWYGKFSASWTGAGTAGTRLSNWLDPISSGVTVLDTLVPVQATATSFGSGCYNTRASFVQTFAANTFDLAGTAAVANVLAFTPTTNGYTVQPGASAWFTPVSPSLGLADEALATLNLPFAFSSPGGTTSVVRMCSNGFLWLNGTSTDTDPTPTFVELCFAAGRFAPFWQNLNPAGGGSTHFDVDPSGQAVYFTWDDVPGVPAGGPGAGNTFQLVLRSNGAVEYRYREIQNQSGTCVVGYSKGAALLALNIDISTAMPITVGLDLNPLSWSALNRPIIGTTQTLNLGNIASPATSIGLAFIGWSQHPFPVDLVIVGAPGCFLHIPAAVIEAYLVGGSTFPWGLGIPANPALSGVEVFTQGALLANGVNPFGLLTANAVKLKIGLY